MTDQVLSSEIVAHGAADENRSLQAARDAADCLRLLRGR